MLSIGGQLYNLTDRDRATLLLEPYFRSLSTAWGVGVGLVDSTFTWPADRFLYLVNLDVDWNSGAAAARATNLQVFWREAVGSPGIQLHAERGGQLVGEGTNVATQDSSRALHHLNVLLPPGQLVVRMNRSDTTVLGAIAPYVCAYLIPPGGIGRSA